MAWAMAFTLAADTFLLLLDRWYGMGIVLFCVVQGLYLARIRRACGRTLWALRAGPGGGGLAAAERSGDGNGPEPTGGAVFREFFW